MNVSEILRLRDHPVELASRLWPGYRLYSKQREILHSLWHNKETICPAGHMLGKDFISGMAAVLFFLTRHPCRVVTTSVDAAQLEGVLWGEMRRFIQESTVPLESTKGGPLICNHLHIRKLVNGRICGLSYMIGRVTAKGEGMSGHHIAQTGDGVPRTFYLADEVSGVDQESHDKAMEWYHRAMLIGNPYDSNTYFKWSVEGRPGTKEKGGDLPNDGNKNYQLLRKIIHIGGIDSPNVQFNLRMKESGLLPDNTIVLPGVLPYSDYIHRLTHWDAVKRTVGVEGKFYKGSENLLYPPKWLDRAERVARSLAGKDRKVEAMGIDPAEGGNSTVWTLIDHKGIIDQFSEKTPNTRRIPKLTRELIDQHKIPCERVGIDLGFGKSAADELREQGYDIRTIAFGAAVTPEIGSTHNYDDKVQAREEKEAYKNRRAEMYGRLRRKLDPYANPQGFGIPEHLTDLRHQLAPIPLIYGPERKLELPPKHPKPGARVSSGGVKSMVELIGHSPDEADSLVIALYVLEVDEPFVEVGAY